MHRIGRLVSHMQAQQAGSAALLSRAASSTATADISDDHRPKVHCVELQMNNYGGRSSFHGPIRTVKAIEDNTLVRKTLEESGKKHVLVVDGGASLRCALMGDKLGELAVQNDWAGVIINGAVRDSAALKKMDVGIKALGTCPLKSLKSNAGQVGIEVRFGGVTMKPGLYAYADEDGILISERPLH